MAKRLQVAIIGMGGFAGVHHDVVAKLEARGELRLACTCDPGMDTFAERQAALDFPARGVRTFRDYREMLEVCAGDLDFVTVPTPIPLHAPMHQACVDRGLPVYLEKPPTLSWQELEAMLAVETRAAKATNVGFNYIIEPERQALKRRLAAGEFGVVRRVTVQACWPRPTTYYTRANWAGRLSLNGGLVLDSPMGNAMAHLVHNALFWAGQGADPWSWGEVRAVRAELYRAHAIQGADTVFLSSELDAGVELRLAMTHACAGSAANLETVHCDKATIYYNLDVGASPAVRRLQVRWQDGRVEELKLDFPNFVIDNFAAYAAYVRGDAPRPMTRLVDSRPFVHLNNLAYLAAGRIVTVSGAATERTPDGQARGEFVAIRDVAAAVDRFIAEGALPSVQALPWAVAGGGADVAQLPKLAQVVSALAADSGIA